MSTPRPRWDRWDGGDVAGPTSDLSGQVPPADEVDDGLDRPQVALACAVLAFVILAVALVVGLLFR